VGASLKQRNRDMISRAWICIIVLCLFGCGKNVVPSPVEVTTILTVPTAPLLLSPTVRIAPIPSETLLPAFTITPPPTIQPFARLGKGKLRTAVWSPDGREIAIATSVGIRLLNARNLDEIAFMDTKSDLQSIAYSPDGKFIASVDSYLRVRLWEIATQRLVREFVYPQAFYNNANIAFSPEGTWLAIATDRKVYILEAKTGDVVYEWSFHGGSTSTHSVVFSPNGQLVAASGFSERKGNLIRVWETTSGEELHTFENGVMDTIWAVAFSPDSEMVIAGSNQYTRYWNVTDGRELETMVENPLRLITAMIVDPQGDWLALSDDCGRVRLDSFHYAPEIVLQEECLTLNSETRTLAFSPDGKTLALSPNDNAVRFWKIGSEKQPETVDGNEHIYYAPIFSPERTGLQVMDGEGNFLEWNWNTEQLTGSTETENTCKVFSSDNTFCVRQSIESDNLKEIWNRLTQEMLFSFESQYELHAIAVSLDGAQLAVAEDSIVSIWDLNQRQLVHTLKGHTDGVWDVAFNRDGTLLASAGGAHDGTVRIWSAVSGDLVRSVIGGRPITFSPEGYVLTVGGWERTEVQIWDLNIEEPLRVIQETDGSIGAIELVPGSSILAVGVGFYGSTVHLWDMTHGIFLCTLAGSTRGISSMVISPDGQTLAAMSDDGTIYLWEINDMLCS
jgi:WD40 repeat protein